ncbi:hypothetical protein NLL29_10240 [Corynebacterium pseudodiphtheriticum]|uniref:hypothetical protein n=1 Tax=Corynebacterium pseudodiphtheriticum TaxID=37637 RepID=UPI0026700F31|nr:hypothetical protein [Corynebacterium pseudodiphtheriticum]WKS31069.1 hypothetical protein NLL29_10240 [Corynebacterium pseudodiphtheriticum]
MCHNIVPLFSHNHPNRDNEDTRTTLGTGRPALYDNAIDTDYTHSIGIQKGQI